ncbi:sugar phosphate isomerase/epimerase family protein [Cohnella luojiensis]|uniref:Sugar phosphate isomerase/epimerase n=1 Tax=Cohnella luojiensis TaxID=652876 RepID=A0A4Y8M2G7_9BACL|nr:TIM barrel protein [Cohnella luojiensis]TFE29488.1 sugar phosphate isomerase/epimerase [Cohnella luojiensis]
MLQHRYRINDGSSSPPGLELQQSWWAMSGIHGGRQDREWSDEEKFERLAEAGFNGILGRLPSEPAEQRRWRQLLNRYGFSFGVHLIPFPRTWEEAVPFLKRAAEFGAQYVNGQVMDQYVIGDEAIRLLDGLTDAGAKEGIPLYIETHRGRITQDVIRTCDYVKAIPGMRLSIDLSHYVVAGTMDEYDEKTEAYFEELLQRTGTLHARISGANQVQIDMESAAGQAMTEHFRRWWGKGMKYWLQDAMPGDRLPFVCELGPIGYAISRYDKRLQRETELSDRSRQALVLKDIAAALWKECRSEYCS